MVEFIGGLFGLSESEMAGKLLGYGGMICTAYLIWIFYVSFFKKGKNYRADVSMTRVQPSRITQVSASVRFNYSWVRAKYNLAAILMVIAGFITIPFGVGLKNFLLGMGLSGLVAGIVGIVILIFALVSIPHFIIGDQSRHKEIDELKHLGNRTSFAALAAVLIHIFGMSGYPTTTGHGVAPPPTEIARPPTVGNN